MLVPSAYYYPAPHVQAPPSKPKFGKDMDTVETYRSEDALINDFIFHHGPVNFRRLEKDDIETYMGQMQKVAEFLKRDDINCTSPAGHSSRVSLHFQRTDGFVEIGYSTPYFNVYVKPAGGTPAKPTQVFKLLDGEDLVSAARRFHDPELLAETSKSVLEISAALHQRIQAHRKRLQP